MGPLVRVRRAHEPRADEITDEAIYLRRREFLGRAVLAAGALATGFGVPACTPEGDSLEVAHDGSLARLEAAPNPRYRVADEVTGYAKATSYNNFYEFGPGKDDPARFAAQMAVAPWSVEIAGEVGKPGVVGLEDLLKPHPLEERIYRLRCVEAWSMVIPWIGFSLGDLLARFAPTSGAKFVVFETLFDPKQMPGQRRGILDWPYREALRLDEAMHPLALLAVGMYGRVLPNQNGAPLRLVVPWKYGFKSIKSIVRIRLVPGQPRTTWNEQIPREYGFYANVNPEVDHPRWSQKHERRIGEFRRRPTLPFNGYAEEVTGLYRGMDLAKFY